MWHEFISFAPSKEAAWAQRAATRSKMRHALVALVDFPDPDLESKLESCSALPQAEMHSSESSIHMFTSSITNETRHTFPDKVNLQPVNAIRPGRPRGPRQARSALCSPSENTHISLPRTTKRPFTTGPPTALHSRGRKFERIDEAPHCYHLTGSVLSAASESTVTKRTEEVKFRRTPSGARSRWRSASGTRFARG